MTLVEKFNNKIIHKDNEDLLKIVLKLILVYIAPIVGTIILFIVNLVLKNQLPPKSLNIIMFYSLVILIFLSLFLIQKWELIGAYGESILLLIPTFVWLLPASRQAIGLMIIFAFVITILTMALAITPVIYAKHNHKHTNEKKMTNMVIFSKLSFMGTSLISTLIVSIIMINWAESMGYANVVDMATDQIELDFTKATWIMFISVVTLFTALSLISIGLISAFEKGKNEISLKQISEKEKIEKTTELLHKKRKQRRNRLKAQKEAEQRETNEIKIINSSEQKSEIPEKEIESTSKPNVSNEQPFVQQPQTNTAQVNLAQTPQQGPFIPAAQNVKPDFKEKPVQQKDLKPTTDKKTDTNESASVKPESIKPIDNKNTSDKNTEK